LLSTKGVGRNLAAKPRVLAQGLGIHGRAGRRGKDVMALIDVALRQAEVNRSLLRTPSPKRRQTGQLLEMW
jgi:hypothetical protein